MTNNIEKLLFLKSIENNEEKNEVCVFYSDNTLQYISYKEGIDLLIFLVNKDNISHKNLYSYEKIECLSKKEFQEKYKWQIGQRKGNMAYQEYVKKLRKKDIKSNEKYKPKQQTKYNTNLQKIISKYKEKFKSIQSYVFRKWKMVLKLATMITVISLAPSCYQSDNEYFYSSNKSKIGLTKASEEGYKEEDSIKIAKAEVKNNMVITILNKLHINNTKKEFITDLWKYLYHYNNDFANSHCEENSNTKPALKFKEVVAQQLIYNHYTKEDLNNIFDIYKLDSNDLYNAYVNGIEQEIRAYTIQKKTLKKEAILKDNRLYSKYEDLNIKFNCEQNKKKKIEIAKTFFKELKKDINFDKKDSLSTNDTTILPVVFSMIRKCTSKDIDNILTEKEQHWYYNSCFDIAKNKLNNLNYNNTIIPIDRSSEIIEHTTFKNIESSIIERLKKDGIYNVSDENRNFENHIDYIEAVSYFENSSKEKKKNMLDSEEYYIIGISNVEDAKEMDKEIKENNQNKSTHNNPVSVGSTSLEDMSVRTSELSNEEKVDLIVESMTKSENSSPNSKVYYKKKV